MNRRLIIPAFCLLMLAGRPALAGGPLVIYMDDHIPVKYQNPEITLHIENGSLGSRSNAEVTYMVEQAFSLWSNLSSSTVALNIDTTRLANTDINGTNFTQYIPSPDGSILNANDHLNPVVYDDDGSIVSAFFGTQSDLILGFAASVYSDLSSDYQEGYIVINGDLPLSDGTLRMLIAHEIAHFFGLDHSQGSISNDDPYCNTDSRENYPLMYPFLCRLDGLHSDDISAVSALYPSTDVYDSYGTLQGHFVDDSGSPVPGANIWAKNIATGEVVSGVSDYLLQGNGYFRLLLPTGNYTLHANSINTLFQGSSGVGPYTKDLKDLSFTAPHPIAEVEYIGSGDSGAEIITVAPGQTINIDFSLTGHNSQLATNSGGVISGLWLLIVASVLTYRHYYFART